MLQREHCNVNIARHVQKCRQQGVNPILQAVSNPKKAPAKQHTHKKKRATVSTFVAPAKQTAVHGNNIHTLSCEGYSLTHPSSSAQPANRWVLFGRAAATNGLLKTGEEACAGGGPDKTKASRIALCRSPWICVCARHAHYVYATITRKIVER